MSNIANTIQYLKGKENRFLIITNQETNRVVGKANIYLEDIPNEDLEQYIKFNLGAITKPTRVWVEMRIKNGTTSKKENTCAIEVSPANTPVEMQPQVNSMVPAIVEPPAQNFLGNPGAGNVFGLGIAEVIGMQVKADRLGHKEEQLAELKEDYKELKHEYNKLDIEHRATLTKLSTAEAQKEMAVMLAKSENKSIFESSAFEKLMDKAPELLGSIVAIKTGGAASPVAGVLGAPMPDGHKEFLEFVAENLNENQVAFLGSVCHFINNPAFVAELKNLLQQYVNA